MAFYRPRNSRASPLYKGVRRYYDELEKKSEMLGTGIDNNLKELGLNYFTTRVGSMLCQFFTDETVTNFQTAVSSDTELYAKYFHAMLESGIYLAPAQFEAMFVSTAHSAEVIKKTIDAHRKAMESII